MDGATIAPQPNALLFTEVVPANPLFLPLTGYVPASQVLLYSYDGVTKTLLADLGTFRADGRLPEVRDVTAGPNNLTYFVVAQPYTEASGDPDTRIWATNGTRAGTAPVDIAGYDDNALNPDQLISLGMVNRGILWISVEQGPR